jgi:hypothetical protein
MSGRVPKLSSANRFAATPRPLSPGKVVAVPEGVGVVRCSTVATVAHCSGIHTRRSRRPSLTSAKVWRQACAFHALYDDDRAVVEVYD